MTVVCRGAEGAVLALAALSVSAQDAARGAALYLRAPGDTPSCVSCHGADLLANRNNFLRAADNPQALQKALNAVGAMGYLKPLLVEQDVSDLAAFLGRVAPLASGLSALQVWPLVAEFGTVGFGATAGPQTLQLRNPSAAPIALQPPRWQGDGFTLQHDCPSVLAPGAHCTIGVRFQGVAVGLASGVVELASDATAQPVMAALGARTVTTAAAVLQWQISELRLRFDTPATDDAASARVGLVNAGVGEAVLAATTIIGPQAAQFGVSGCAAGTRLAPSASCELVVRYTRTSAAAADASLQLRSDGANPPSLALRAEASPPVRAPEPASGGGVSGPAGLAALTLVTAWLWRLPRRRR